MKTDISVPISTVMFNVQEQIYNRRDIQNYEYDRKMRICRCKTLSHMQKHRNRRVCSKERLDNIDSTSLEKLRSCYCRTHC